MTSQFCGYVAMPGSDASNSGASATTGYTHGVVIPGISWPASTCDTHNQ